MLTLCGKTGLGWMTGCAATCLYSPLWYMTASPRSDTSDKWSSDMFCCIIYCHWYVITLGLHSAVSRQCRELGRKWDYQENYSSAIIRTSEPPLDAQWDYHAAHCRGPQIGCCRKLLRIVSQHIYTFQNQAPSWWRDPLMGPAFPTGHKPAPKVDKISCGMFQNK